MSLVRVYHTPGHEEVMSMEICRYDKCTNSSIGTQIPVQDRNI